MISGVSGNSYGGCDGYDIDDNIDIVLMMMMIPNKLKVVIKNKIMVMMLLVTSVYNDVVVVMIGKPYFSDFNS